MVQLKIDLPEKFYEDELRDGYLISSDMKKVWAVLFDLLNEFMQVCKKHNIKWWADAGTILGAARHKGMIPWDDDIDVMMMRDDYIRLCEIAPKEFKHPYFFQTEETDKGSIRGHAQLRNSETTGMIKDEFKMNYNFNQGIFLDIFPIDIIPDDDTLLQEQIRNIQKYRARYYKYCSISYRFRFRLRRNIVRMVVDFVLHLLAISVMKQHFSYEKPYRQFVEEGQKYNGINSSRVCKMVLCPIKPRRIWNRSWFNNTVYLPFEMFQIPVPSGYKELLDTFYGDWHTYKIGAATHGGCFFDTEKPYTEYLK